ncbi:MAG: protein kinase [Rubrivivax sp.]
MVVSTTTGCISRENTTIRRYAENVLSPGTQVDRYELICPIGEGGMAQVWVARQRGKHGFAKLFALKSIHARFAADPHFRARFLEEARIAAAIEHPGCVSIFDLGETNDILYLVMEYVDGDSLWALTSGKSPIVPTGVALRIAADACAALHAAHRLTDANGVLRGVVHRDVSPQNILISVRGDVKLIDFGIAKARDRLCADTGEGTLTGKLRYMAPEQAKNEALGPYTDVFAAGAVLYRMLAGKAPFDGGNDTATFQHLLAGTPPAPLPPDVPPLVAAIVDRALSYDPGDRYATAFGMQTALKQAIASERLISNVTGWVKENLSERARARRAELDRLAREAPDSSPQVPDLDLAPSSRVPRVPARPAVVTAPMGSNDAVLDAPVLVTNPPPMLGAKQSEEAMGAFQLASTPRNEGLSPPEPIDDTPPPPGFMDIGALVKKRASAADVEPPPPGPPPADEPAPARDPAVKNESAAPKPRPKDDADARAEARGSATVKLGILGIVLLVVLGAVVFLLPVIIKDRAIANARAMGVDLTIGRVSVGFSGAAMHDVKAKIVTVPGVDLSASDVSVEGWTSPTIRISGVNVRLDGRVTDVGQSLAIFYATNQPRITGTPSDPRKISVVSAHVGWKNPFGEETSIDAGEVGIEVDSSKGEESRASIGRFEIKTAKTLLGPWSASFERTRASSRVRLLFESACPRRSIRALRLGRRSLRADHGADPAFAARAPRHPPRGARTPCRRLERARGEDRVRGDARRTHRGPREDRPLRRAPLRVEVAARREARHRLRRIARQAARSRSRDARRRAVPGEPRGDDHAARARAPRRRDLSNAADRVREARARRGEELGPARRLDPGFRPQNRGRSGHGERPRDRDGLLGFPSPRRGKGRLYDQGNLWALDLRPLIRYEPRPMRGFLQPALKKVPTENQIAFSQLSRGRRVKLAEAAQTTLVKASQWARGDVVPQEVATALEAQTKQHLAKKKS